MQHNSQLTIRVKNQSVSFMNKKRIVDKLSTKYAGNHAHPFDYDGPSDSGSSDIVSMNDISMAESMKNLRLFQ